ncbi:hypothetical protein ACFX2G_012609 [Malus domestica]
MGRREEEAVVGLCLLVVGTMRVKMEVEERRAAAVVETNTTIKEAGVERMEAKVGALRWMAKLVVGEMPRMGTVVKGVLMGA